MSPDDRLQEFVTSATSCAARWVETTPVAVTLARGMNWGGNVDTLDVDLPAGTTRCYAWNHDEAFGGWRPLMLFASASVDSPEAAVRSCLEQGSRLTFKR